MIFFIVDPILNAQYFKLMNDVILLYLNFECYLYNFLCFFCLSTSKYVSSLQKQIHKYSANFLFEDEAFSRVGYIRFIWYSILPCILFKGCPNGL